MRRRAIKPPDLERIYRSADRLPDLPRPSVVDRVVGVFNPKRMVERVGARYAAMYMEQSLRSHLARNAFKASEFNRLNNAWSVSSQDINMVLKTELPTMRNRSRWLLRNNPYAVATMNAYLNYIVGTGFDLQMEVYRWVEGDEEAEKQFLDNWNDYVEDQFRDWGEDCDIHASESTPACFNDAQSFAVRKLVEDGEVFIHKAVDRSHPVVPLRLEFIDPEAVTCNLTEYNGNPILMGVELAKNSFRPVAYWVRTTSSEHPYLVSQSNHIRVPAGNMLHAFIRRYPRQVRGIPHMAAVTQRFYDLDEYTDAELIGNKIAACFSVIFETPSGNDLALLATPTDALPTDADGNTLANIAPGIFGTLPPGVKPHIIAPQKPGATYDMFTRQHIKAMGAGTEIGLSYPTMTRDTQGVSYAGGRLAQQTDFQGFRRFQKFVSQSVCRGVLYSWLDLAVTIGRVQAPGYWENTPGKRFWRRHSWMPAGWDWAINPLQEVEASNRKMRGGVSTLADECSLLGKDWKGQLRMHERVRRECKRRGIVLSSDAATGNVSRSGEIPDVVLAQSAQDADQNQTTATED